MILTFFSGKLKGTDEFGNKVKNVKDMMASIKVEKNVDYPTIMVAVNSLSHLVTATKWRKQSSLNLPW